MVWGNIRTGCEDVGKKAVSQQFLRPRGKFLGGFKCGAVWGESLNWSHRPRLRIPCPELGSQAHTQCTLSVGKPP